MHAYGSAEDVPRLLRDLRSADARSRGDALWGLFGNVFHQGSRYEASAYAVPFLLELVADPATPDRHLIVHLLASLAVGYDEVWLPRGFAVEELRAFVRDHPVGPEDDQRLRQWLLHHEVDDGIDMPIDEEQEAALHASWELAAYDAVKAGVEILLAALGSDNPANVRRFAAHSLAWFPEVAGRILAALSEAVRADPDDRVAATALVAMGLLTREENGDLRALAQEALTGMRPLPRWAAAVALARIGPLDAADRVAEELRWWMTIGEAYSTEDMPFLDGDVRTLAAMSLTQLGDSAETVDAMIRTLGDVTGATALGVTDAILATVFPDGPMTPGTAFSALTEKQQRAVRAIARAQNAWYLDYMIFANFAALMTSYGLPATYDGCRRYVGLQ